MIPYKNVKYKYIYIYSLNIPTKLSVCFVAVYNVHTNPPITLTMNLTKTSQSSRLPSGSSSSGFVGVVAAWLSSTLPLFCGGN